MELTLSSQLDSALQSKTKEEPPYPSIGQPLTIVFCILGYLVPGLGHLCLGRVKRGLIFFGSIIIMFALGIIMKGHLYEFNVDNPAERFTNLLAVANAGTGLAYFIPYLLHIVSTTSIGFGAPQAAAATYEYGNTFLWTAGLLNYLVVIDVFDIGMGRKK
jgi:hypothetical protein